MSRAVFFDRDGVINKAIVKNGLPYPPLYPEEVEIIPGLIEVTNMLTQNDYKVIGITNQPDVARGIQTRDNVEKINKVILDQVLGITQIYTCYHDDADGCQCRKPSPGLLFQAAVEYSIELTDSYFIGDRWRDIEAGQRAGCRSILVDYGYSCEKTRNCQPDYIIKTIEDLLDIILYAQ